MSMAMPRALYHSNTLNTPIGALIFEFDRGPRKDKWETTLPQLLGYRIPHFQRPLVWTTTQKIAFIESAWLELHLGVYLVNRFDVETRPGIIHNADRLLLDGQQRLEAIRAYLSNEFSVFGHTWNSLPELDRRRFDNIIFARAESQVDEEKTLREIYNRLNFGGTPHTENQKA